MAEETLLTTEEVLLLENLTYLKDPDKRTLTELCNAGGGQTVGELLNSINTSQYINDKDYGSYMTGADWKNTIEAIKSNPDLMNMEIATVHVDNSEGGGGGQSAVFVNRDTGEAVVAFRGTSDKEWKDNFTGGGPTGAKDGVSTAQQENALEWYQDAYEQCGLEDYTVTVTGHSKGGNKAKYITLLDDTVDRCVSFDGQGFSDEFVTAYRDEIAARQGLIENHNVDYDYVNILLNDVGNTTYYQGMDIGSGGFLENHCPNTFFSFGEDGEVSMIPSASGQAEEMQVLDEFLNSYLRSLSPSEKVEALDLVGSIAQEMLTGGDPQFILDLMTDESNRETAAYLLAYVIKYEETNPEFGDAVAGILNAFDMENAAKITDVVCLIMDSGYFDDILRFLDKGIEKMPGFVWDMIADIIKDKAGLELTGEELEELLRTIGIVSDKIDTIKIADGKDIRIHKNALEIIQDWIDSFDLGKQQGMGNSAFYVKTQELDCAAKMFDNCREALQKAVRCMEPISGSGSIQSGVNPILENMRTRLEHEATKCRELNDTLNNIVNVYKQTEAVIVG